MQFIFIPLLALVFLFFATFFISGITESLRNVSLGSSVQSGFFRNSINTARGAEDTASSPARPLFNEPLKGVDLAAVLGDIDGASRFQELFREVNGASYIQNSDTLYTLFVPLDTAFTTLPYEAQRDLNTMSAEEKRRFVTNHLVPQKMVAVGGQRLGYVNAISRETLNFSLYERGGVVGNANVVAVYPAENGIVYVIDGVLTPPEVRPLFIY